ncbi:MAG: DUF4465 domain-containing protein [Bacteroidetes bacterium]|nr:DUF4465 domain-containing protein [Bacteroidota bacterium]
MKKINLLFLAMCFALISFAQTVSDFESLTLPADSFWNGADLTGGFSDGNAFFASDYSVAFQLWGGFGYSNKKDTTTSGYQNDFSAITGEGFYGSSNYAVANLSGQTKIRLTGIGAGKQASGFYVTNATYAYLSMKDGDAFCKKFGGVSGNEEDWFKLTAKGWLNGAEKKNRVDFYLADFRSSDNSEDYILKTWEWLDLIPLGNVDSIQFFLSSSDTGLYGMNTPAYFCLDNFTTADVANNAPVAMNDEVMINYLEDTLIDVLSNDIDVDALPLTVQLISSPMIPGAYAADSNGTHIYYQPAVGIVATDTLYYRVCDAAMECDTAMLVVRVNSLTGIEDLTENDILLSPNPFTGSFAINFPEGTERIELFDINGRMVKNKILKESMKQEVIQTTDLLSGLYFVKVFGGGASVVLKALKQ